MNPLDLKPTYESPCGRAVLYCGDCRSILPTIKHRIDAIISDPPYGIDFRYGGGGRGFRCAKHTDPIWGDDAPFDPSHLFEICDKILIFGANYYAKRLPDGGDWIAWDKSVGTGPNTTFRDAEFAWSSVKTARNIIHHLWIGCVREGEDASAKQRRLHVSQKPLEVMIQCIALLRVRLGDTICDPYMGSGTTGVAAIRTGHRFIGIEIDERYVSIAKQRIEEELSKNESA